MNSHLHYSNTSNHSSDLEQDRRLINQKLQLRRSKQQQEAEEEEDDQSVLDYYNNTGSRRNIYGDSNLDIDDGVTEEEYLLRQAHAQDEQMIGGKVDGTEGLEAMNQALTSPPVAWWAKRKQWQKKRNFGMKARVAGFGRNSINAIGGEEGADNLMLGDSHQEEMEMIMMMEDDEDEGGGAELEEEMLGHPVMLTDPSILGYDMDAFRQAAHSGGYTTPTSSSNSNSKKKRGPMILYVTRAEIKRRHAQQTAYIVSALFVVFLFMFCLEQLKLAQYAMVESPVPLHAYLAGEDREDYNDPSKVTLQSLGLQDFGGNIQGIPVVEFGKIELDRDDPLAQQVVQTETAVEGGGMTTDEEEQHQQSAGIIHSSDYFEILKGVISGWGVTPVDVFANELSPQYKALHWMAYEDILRRQPDTDFQIKKIIQRYALSVIYFATSGELWRHSALFLSNLDECSWNMKIEPRYFLGAGDCEGGLVTRLDLWGNHLTVSLFTFIGILVQFIRFIFLHYTHYYFLKNCRAHYHPRLAH